MNCCTTANASLFSPHRIMAGRSTTLAPWSCGLADRRDSSVFTVWRTSASLAAAAAAQIDAHEFSAPPAEELASAVRGVTFASPEPQGPCRFAVLRCIRLLVLSMAGPCAGRVRYRQVIEAALEPRRRMGRRGAQTVLPRGVHCRATAMAQPCAGRCRRLAVRPSRRESCVWIPTSCE